MASFDAALPVLRASGVSVVGKVVGQSILAKIKATDVYKSMPTEYQRPGGSTMGSRRRGPAAAPRPIDLWPTSARGRYHRREESFSEEDVKSFEELEQAVWPLVKAFFEEENVSMGEVFRSELQVLNAVPDHSLDQAWHKDNQRRGLTIIVPLVDFTTTNGPTQVIVGSHAGEWSDVARAGGARVVLAPVGAVAAYDSRTFHRGLGNQSAAGRPAVILCYDLKATPPPGHSSPYTSISDSYAAGGLSLLCAGWELFTK